MTTTTTTDTFSLTLDNNELVFLGQSIKASAFWLVDTNADAKESSDDEQWLKQVQDNLAAKGYATTREEDGTFAVDPTIPALVGALAFARSALVVTVHNVHENQVQSRLIHFAEGLIIEHEQAEDDTHLLTAIRDIPTLHARLEELLPHTNGTSPFSGVQQIDQESFEAASYLIEKKNLDSATQRLQQAGIPPDFAHAVVQALSEPEQRVMLQTVAFADHKIHRYDTLHVVVAGDILWFYQFVREEDRAYIQIETASQERLNQQLQAYIRMASSL